MLVLLLKVVVIRLWFRESSQENLGSSFLAAACPTCVTLDKSLHSLEPYFPCFYLLSFLFFFFFFFPLRATPGAHGSSQSRGQIGAVAVSLHHSSWQRQILYPLSKARDWTHVFMDTSWVCYGWATMETPYFPYF